MSSRTSRRCFRSCHGSIPADEGRTNRFSSGRNTPCKLHIPGRRTWTGTWRCLPPGTGGFKIRSPTRRKSSSLDGPTLIFVETFKLTFDKHTNIYKMWKCFNSVFRYMPIIANIILCDSHYCYAYIFSPLT